MWTRLGFRACSAASVEAGSAVARVSRMGQRFAYAAGEAASASGKLSPTARNTSSAVVAPAAAGTVARDLRGGVVAVARRRRARAASRVRRARSSATALDTTDSEPMMIALRRPQLA